MWTLLLIVTCLAVELIEVFGCCEMWKADIVWSLSCRCNAFRGTRSIRRHVFEVNDTPYRWIIFECSPYLIVTYLIENNPAWRHKPLSRDRQNVVARTHPKIWVLVLTSSYVNCHRSTRRKSHSATGKQTRVIRLRCYVTRVPVSRDGCKPCW